MKKALRLSAHLIIIAFFLSLFFHTIIILYSLVRKTSSLHDFLEKKEEELKIMRDRDEWVHTKARAGSFGAPIFFQDEPEEYVEPTTQQPNDQPRELQQPESITELHQQPEQQTVQKPQLTTSIQEPLSHSIPSQKSLATKTKLPEKVKPLVRQTIRFDEYKRKPPLSLSQLTQGFLEHARNQGTHSIEMIGKKMGIASDMQMKYERYIEKILWCMQNSCIIHRSKTPTYVSDILATIVISIARDGTLKELRMIQSSGYRDIDTYMMFICKDASSSFPPVPSYIPDNIVRFGIHWRL